MSEDSARAIAFAGQVDKALAVHKESRGYFKLFGHDPQLVLQVLRNPLIPFDVRVTVLYHVMSAEDDGEGSWEMGNVPRELIREVVSLVTGEPMLTWNQLYNVLDFLCYWSYPDYLRAKKAAGKERTVRMDFAHREPPEMGEGP